MTENLKLPRKLSEELKSPPPQRPSHADVIEHLERWANSPGLQPPTSSGARTGPDLLEAGRNNGENQGSTQRRPAQQASAGPANKIVTKPPFPVLKAMPPRSPPAAPGASVSLESTPDTRLPS